MNPQSKIPAAVLALGLFIASAGAHAVAITDVTFSIPPGGYEFADAASPLQSGNDSVADINALTGDFAGDPWVLLDKTDESSTPFEGVTFNLDATQDATSGTWELSWSGPGLPTTMDFVFVTKASNNWGAYLFEGLELTAANSPGDGTFLISWTTGGGPNPPTPGLSHASIYGRVGGDDPDIPMPVPGTLLLVGLGLGLVRYASSKR